MGGHIVGVNIDDRAVTVHPCIFVSDLDMSDEFAVSSQVFCAEEQGVSFDNFYFLFADSVFGRRRKKAGQLGGRRQHTAPYK